MHPSLIGKALTRAAPINRVCASGYMPRVADNAICKCHCSIKHCRPMQRIACKWLCTVWEWDALGNKNGVWKLHQEMYLWQDDLVLVLPQLVFFADEVVMACAMLSCHSALHAPQLHAGHEMMVLESTRHCLKLQGFSSQCCRVASTSPPCIHTTASGFRFSLHVAMLVFLPFHVWPFTSDNTRWKVLVFVMYHSNSRLHLYCK